MNTSPWTMKTDILQLLDQKQVWELSDCDLEAVKQELLRMCRKCNNEQELRNMCAESKRSDFYQDTPLAEAYGG